MTLTYVKFILLFLLAGLAELNAQTLADTAITTSFRKGRNMIGFAGSIRSTKIGESNYIVSDQFLNEYSFDFNLGKFVANKHMIGLVFSSSRDESAGYLDIEKEFLLLGPQYRIYLLNSPDMGLFFRSHLFWAYYIENSVGSQGIYLVDESIKGHGFGGAIGFGYSYVIADKIAFEIGFEYLLAYFRGNFYDNLLGTKQAVNFNRKDYRFSFGFNLLFDRLKNE